MPRKTGLVAHAPHTGDAIPTPKRWYGTPSTRSPARTTRNKPGKWDKMLMAVALGPGDQTPAPADIGLPEAPGATDNNADATLRLSLSPWRPYLGRRRFVPAAPVSCVMAPPSRP